MSLILIVDDNRPILEHITNILEPSGHEIVACSCGREALDAFASRDFDLIISDLMMPDLDGFELIGHVRRSSADVPIIIITGFGGLSEAITAIRSGANDFIVKPFEAEDFSIKVGKNLELYRMRREIDYLRNSLDKISEKEMIFGASPESRRIYDQILKVAPTNASVIIRGESGTGKELASRFIHRMSARSSKPFVAVDCGSLSESVIESELFGYVKGAFTGADKTRRGILSEADGGTVFLDEIGNLTLSVQSKLLRFIQEREYKPVGSNVSIKINVRIVSATNADLAASVKKGEFREDLYYRLAGIEIFLPPLRERRAEIEMLARHFIKKHYAETGKRVVDIDRAAIDLLRGHGWPGNIREFEHLIEYAMIIEPGDTICADTVRSVLPGSDSQTSFAFSGTNLREAVDEFEKQHILKIISLAGGNRALAARMMGISRSILYERLNRHGIM